LPEASDVNFVCVLYALIYDTKMNVPADTQSSGCFQIVRRKIFYRRF